MARKAIGKVEPVQKIWLTRKEAAAYLGVTPETMRTKIDMNPMIELYQIEERVTLYDIRDLEKFVRSKRVKKFAESNV